MYRRAVPQQEAAVRLLPERFQQETVPVAREVTMTKYARLASAADLRKVREGAKHKIILRRYDRQPSDKKFQILVCGGTGCTSSGSNSVRAAFEESLKKHGTFL